ncbi:universal stress protein [Haloplanus natans]|uniref:universal stress protein n=1 Tax=Haloplanus natans TaxID=376171 RepID=UPI000677F7F4|nr:universal stress protein [Haloplanus natans]
MIENILVATDGSDAAKQATKHAVRIAAVSEATIHALHVVSPRLLRFLEDSADQTIETESFGGEAVRTAEQIADEAGVGIRASVERGNPAETILSYAESNDIDLITMGTHGRAGLPRYVFGSVAETVLRTATCPVLAAHASEQLMSYDDILVPIAGEREGRNVPQMAIDFAEQFDATLHLVHVVDRRLLASSYDLCPARPDVESELSERGEALLRSAKAPLEAAGIDFGTHLKSGLPISQLREFVTTANIDLVVMWSHRRRGPDRVLQGSVAESLLRSVTTPMLMVSDETQTD